MLFAGSDTSAGTLALLFRMLATHPAVAERAAAEAAAVLVGRPAERLTASDATRRMPYINACLNETLRLFPPGPFLVRIASEGMKIRGYDVPKGQMLVANIYSVHRHRAFYNRPDEFLPERWLPEGAAAGLAPRQANAWLPFSKGTRSCIGRGYAQLQMPIVAAAVLSRVRFELARAPMAVDSIAARAAGSSSDNGAPVADDLELVSSLTLKAKGGVWLRPVLL